MEKCGGRHDALEQPGSKKARTHVPRSSDHTLWTVGRYTSDVSQDPVSDPIFPALKSLAKVDIRKFASLFDKPGTAPVCTRH